MTLLLDWISPAVAFSISDRMVSQAGRRFDAQSNKAVLFLAADATVAFSYTGNAFLDGIPTDHWLAATLAGTPVEEPRRPAGIRFCGSSPSLFLGPCLRSVANQLNRLRLERATPAKTFEILAAGWKWPRRGRSRPVIVSIEWDAAASAFAIKWSPRHLGRRQLLAVAPEGNMSPDEVVRLRQQLRVPTGDDPIGSVESTLIGAVRSVAERMPGLVGTECMSVLIPPAEFAIVHLRCASLVPPFLSAVPVGGGPPAFTAPATFTPWIVARGMICAPQVTTGPHVQTMAGRKIRIHAPTPQIPGLLVASGSVERPLDPRRIPVGPTGSA